MKIQDKLKKHNLKFLSVIFSFFLWAYVLNSEKVRFEKNVSVEYLMPDELVVAQRLPGEVTFLIEGPRAFMRSILQKQQKLIVDLEKLNPRRDMFFNLEISSSQLELPYGVSVERVIPKLIPIRFERKVSKILPVKLVFTKQFNDSQVFHKKDISPSEVEVFGPPSILSQLSSVSTRPIDHSKLIGKGQVDLELDLGDDRLVLAGENKIAFNYELKTNLFDVVVQKVPIKFLGNEQKFSTNIRTADVKLRIQERIFKNRSNISSSIQIWADIPSGPKGEQLVKLKIVAPPGLEVMTVNPDSILVNIK